LHRKLVEAALAGVPYAIPAIALSEVSYGAHAGASRNPSLLNHLDWLTGQLGSLINVLPLTAQAAELAGELRAKHPLPPTGTRRRAGQRPEQRVAWVMDLFIAATAWVHGHDVVTSNVDDFARIALLLPYAGATDRLAVHRPESL
jgi:predicted nucleic acid-binding protein